VGVAGSGPGQVGYGEGLGAGLGVSITTTVGSPTLRQLLNNLGFPAGSAAGCN